MPVIKLRFNDKLEVNKVLDDIRELELDEVFVVGRRAKGGPVFIGCSGTKQMNETLGDLEIIKDHLLKHWD